MKRKMTAGIIVLSLLISVFGCASDSRCRQVPEPEEKLTAVQSVEAVEENSVQQEVPETDVQDGDEVQKNTQTESQNSIAPDPGGIQPAAEEQKTDVHEPEVSDEPESVKSENDQLVCTLSVRCDTILKNPDMLRPEKAGILPENGIILEETAVAFYDGESVFNLLLREMKRNKIHFEFVNIPVYNSAYIEGIANIYEFDCGELSGWMYKVNGWFPNYGCSNYKLKAGDKVELVYTCDLGKDVGGSYSERNGN